MVIRKVSKTDLVKSKHEKENRKESESQRLSREFDEKEAHEKEVIKQKKIDEKNEKLRAESIIIPYLESLDMQITDKHLWSFWAWPDRKGFKKINKMTYADMKDFVKEDKKYADRLIAHFKLFTGHTNKYSRADRTWISVDISIFHIDENNNIKNKKDPSWGCHIIWNDDDFKISKLSFKLLEELMRIVAAKRHRCESLAGYRLTTVIKDLKKKKIDISDVLNPLAGI